MNVFVVRTTTDDGQPIPGVYDELQKGRARMGWSYLAHLDLRLIRDRIERGDPLGKTEGEAHRCVGFLTKVQNGDYLLYPHQPERGCFSVVRVTGEYNYSPDAYSLNGDFRSFRRCQSLADVAMNDTRVPTELRERLGRPGRFSQVYDPAPFFSFLADWQKTDGQVQRGDADG